MADLIPAARDGVTFARRNLRKVTRVPEILVSVLISPLMMVLMFAYVFGGSIDIPGGSYREFLVGGTFALTLTSARRSPAPAWHRTCVTGSSTGSARCRCPGPPWSWAGRRATCSTTCCRWS